MIKGAFWQESIVIPSKHQMVELYARKMIIGQTGQTKIVTSEVDNAA